MSNQSKKNNIVVNVLFIVFIIVVAFIIFKGFGSSSSSSLNSNQQNKNMPEKPTTLGIVTTQEGTGEVAKAGDRVSMNYTGKLWSSGTVFDSNVDPKFNHVRPFEFTLGAGEVISGWDVGIVGMKEGEKRTLTIPSDMAYGASGRPGVIPPDSVLVFDVELVKVLK